MLYSSLVGHLQLEIVAVWYFCPDERVMRIKYWCSRQFLLKKKARRAITDVSTNCASSAQLMSLLRVTIARGTLALLLLELCVLSVGEALLLPAIKLHLKWHVSRVDLLRPHQKRHAALTWHTFDFY